MRLRWGVANLRVQNRSDGGPAERIRDLGPAVRSTPDLRQGFDPTAGGDVRGTSSPVTWELFQFDRALDRPQDSRVAPAAADVTFQGLPDRIGSRRWIRPQQRRGSDHHPGGAETTLERAHLHERPLNGIQCAVLLKSLDRGHFSGTDFGKSDLAGLHGPVVQENGTRAALTLSATVLRTRESEIFSKDGEEAAIRHRTDRLEPPIDPKIDRASRHRKGLRPGELP